MIAQLQQLTERINGTSHSDKAASWIGGKISKPSLDTIGGWLDRRFTKLVTGDGDGDSPEEDNKKAASRTFDGPFNHYSTISNSPSARSSPQPTPPQHLYAPPQRTSSAMAVQTYHPTQPLDRAASAMDYHNAPVSYAYGAHANYSTPALGQPLTQADRHLRQFSTESAKQDPHSGSSTSQDQVETPVQGSSWWDYSSGANAQTPTATTFMKVDEAPVTESPNGFISLMDTQQFGYQPKSASAPPEAPSAQQRYEEEDDMEDLGFGNKKTSQKADSGASTPVETASKTDAPTAPAPAASTPPSNSSAQQNGRPIPSLINAGTY